jgi:hypothetical protein
MVATRVAISAAVHLTLSLLATPTESVLAGEEKAEAEADMMPCPRSSILWAVGHGGSRRKAVKQPQGGCWSGG